MFSNVGYQNYWGILFGEVIDFRYRKTFFINLKVACNCDTHLKWTSRIPIVRHHLHLDFY
ncbi:hypothetical protein BV352_00229 [Pseudomonas syringae pv. actinidiae]|nr:hypothetical protein BV352_00229 [Pseudomonas syringae pv. actinidiae]OSS10985.1 hypothetical protein BV333_00486 [Pseudomonas syringae pv. actinidiae]OSS15208.1 hypothetical protein BV334_00672 [Pseudomonas syringae pv. actinidiae]OSS21519.1 hypothetical protein BV335_00674 [Pseudomonas syringae pv. actinidiae]